MSSTIQPLPTDVVHLIAAGEVIDSLAAVVRELAENAIDAAATRISVQVDLERWQVRVADNGCGMSLEDLRQAAQPHSTSKIRASQDLNQISSLGFRGEALHSLAQLADLEICSHSPDAEAGWRILYDRYGHPQTEETVAIAPGTIVTATQLFGRWLARRQALPSPAQQLRAVQLTLYHLALCHPAITWHVQQGTRDWFSIYPGSSAHQILPQILRTVQPADLQEFSDSLIPSSPLPSSPISLSDALPAPPSPEFPNSPIPSLYLLLGLPDRCHRHRPDWIKVAINGRMVRSPELEQTLIGALRRTLPRDRHPVCFLHLRVAPDQIDWNRHPAKAEIYLRHLDQWRDRVKEAIAQTLTLQSDKLSDRFYTGRVSQLLKTAEAQGRYGSRQIQTDEPIAAERNAETEGATWLSSSDHAPLVPLRAQAQVHNMYILAEHPSGIWLIEQHIAHERVLYEQLRDRWIVVPLNSPIILSQLTPAQVEQLQRLTLDVEPFGEALWAVRTAPTPLAQRQDCAEALLELSLGGDLESALVATACRTAIRNGTPLSIPEMQALLDRWQRTQNPRTCPHGRPIYLPLEESSLSRFFRRHWVIGKSHGI